MGSAHVGLCLNVWMHVIRRYTHMGGKRREGGGRVWQNEWRLTNKGVSNTWHDLLGLALDHA
eukprot:357302-Chlamydomonas_euryale.AAC.2